MLSPKFRLALAITLAGASLTFLAVALNAAKTLKSIETSAPPLKAKILRAKNKLKNKLDAAEIEALRRQAKSQDTTEERQLEDTTPKHVPIKVKIKKEKEGKFKDLKNEHWVRDLEIEVKNTGTKPIYFLHLQLDLETVGPDGKEVGFVLLYGRSDLVDVKAAIKPDDVPIRPGETHTFTIADRFVKGYERIVREFTVRQPRKVKVIFQQITFGDGTGFWDASGTPLPGPKRAATEPCKQKGGETKRANISFPLLAFNATGKARWSESLPALAPANFLSQREGAFLGIEVTAEPDTCCPGSSCTWAKSSLRRCYCSNREDPAPDIPSVTFPSCGDSSGGGCKTITSRTEWCEYPNVDGTTFPLSCQYYSVFSCVDYAPTPPPAPSPSPTSSTQASPTPSPSPEPTCDPATKPNNTNCICDTTPYTIAGAPPQWQCGVGCNGATGADYRQPEFQSNLGCPPNKYNDGDCCRCIVTTCPNGQNVNPITCQCPTPTPIATAQPGGPGGGPGEGGWDPYGNCTPYYWVWWYSYDDGETWVQGPIDYAGCW